MFGALTSGLVAICGLAIIGCFIFVVIKMFQNGDKTMGIISLVTIPCGIGMLIAFIFGWMNVGKYNAMLVMVIYTLSMLVLGPASFMSGIMN